MFSRYCAVSIYIFMNLSRKSKQSSCIDFTYIYIYIYGINTTAKKMLARKILGLSNNTFITYYFGTTSVTINLTNFFTYPVK